MGPSLAAAARRLAGRLGTPFYLYDVPRLHADASAVRAAFPDPWLRLYALKANALPALVGDLPALGFGAGAVSRGELELARRAGFATTVTALEGVGKGTAELAVAVRLAAAGEPLLWTSLESAEEASELARAAEHAGLREPLDVLVRVNPMVRPETRRGLAVGAADAKFGVSPDEVADVVAAGGGSTGPLRWRGVHLHAGSQLGAVDAWRASFRLGLRLLALRRGALPDFDTVDAGGGFPVAYGEEGSVPPVERFAQVARDELAEVGRPSVRLAVEPGRAVVAGCGWIVARVLHVRERAGSTVILDAGMTELIRPALYGAEHPMMALTSMGRPRDADAGRRPEERTRVRVHGPVCESTDTLGEASLPPLERGDLVAIGMSGAYASSMASTYNGRPRAPEVAWDGRHTHVLRRRTALAALAGRPSPAARHPRSQPLDGRGKGPGDHDPIT